MSDKVKRCTDARYKQKAIIEFLTFENRTPIEIHRRLKSFFGDQSFDVSTVRYWVRMAKQNSMNLTDLPRSGRPKLEQTADLKQKIDQKIHENRRITQRQLADQLGTSQTTVHRLIRELNYSRICAKWVPKLLTTEMKANRKEMCEQLLNRYWQEGETFLKNLVTGDESWVSHYDPELKDTSTEYRHRSSPRHKKLRTERATGKIMLTIFWDMQGIVHREYLPKGMTVNSDRYVDTLRKLKRRIQRIRPNNNRFILQHDNARPHTSGQTRQSISSLNFDVVPHPPYSPDLAPSDFYLFRHLKKGLKGTRFASDADLQAAITSWLREQPQEFYENGIRKLIKRWMKCIALDGDYVEV